MAIRRTVTPQVREEQCARTDHGALTEASTLRWRPGRWPTRVLYIEETGATRMLTHYRPVYGHEGEVCAMVYSDTTGWSLEVVDD